MKKGQKIWKKNGFALGTIAVVVLVLVSLTYLSGNYLYSSHYSLDGSTPVTSTCESCLGGKSVYSSGQFTYGSNWGTWYVNQNALFPISLKVNDMYNEQSIDDVYTKYRVILRNKTTGAFIKDFSGNFENAGYMESASIYHNFVVPNECVVEAEVYLSRDGGLSWEESYYYLTGTRPTWIFKFQPTSVADIDKDGIPDDTDMCPTQPETVNGYLDADGCPDTVPSGTTVVPSDGTTTTIVPSDSEPPTANSLPSGSDDPDDTTSVDGDDATGTHPWLTEGSYEGLQVLSGVYPAIIYPEKTLLANANYQFKSPATLYFEGAGPDEDQTSHIVTDPNYTNPLNPWWRGVADVTNLETVGYAWDIDSDGEADYTTKSFEHEFVVSESQKTKIFQVMFRAKMKSITTDEYFWSMPVQMNIKVYAEGAYTIWDIPCSEYGSNLGPILQPMASVFCYISKGVQIAVNLPLIITANIWYALTEVFCIGSYPGFWANSIPLIVFGAFLLLMLVPDNVISFAGGSALAYLLGTTAPAIGLSSIPMLTALGTVAIPAGIASVGLFSSAGIGPLAIVLIFAGLALFQILFGEGSQSFSKTENKGFIGGGKSGAGSHNNITYVKVNVAGSSGMDKARTVFADAVLILSVLMIAECKFGAPIYSAVWKIVWLIPNILIKLAEAFNGMGVI